MTTTKRPRSSVKAPSAVAPTDPVEVAPLLAAGDVHIVADSADDSVSDVRQYVTFMTGDQVFAVDISPVQEIIRVPAVVRVPLAPTTLDGLANLRGKVLPIISLRRVFGYAEAPHDDATRALVIDTGQPLGFVVDKVSSVVGVEAGKLEGVESIQGTVNTELLSGIIKDVGGHAMIMVLDFARLIAREFADIADLVSVTRRAAATGQRSEVDADAEDDTSDQLQLVSFEVAGQEYAITIEDVKEIVQLPETIVAVPHAEAHVLGVMTLRQRLLPLVSLRRMFGLPAQDADDRSRIVVVSLGASSVGIIMDSVNEVLRVARSDVDAMPPLFTRSGTLSDISQICRLDDGKRLVSIISAANLFRHSAIKEALTTVDAATEHALQGDEVASAMPDDDEQVVVFHLDKEEFGAPIESVQEIVRVPESLTRVPRAPDFVEGVINLRGAVLPVIDLRRRLGLGSLVRSDRQRIMVFLINGMRTGFIVDSVAQVLKIPKSSIEAAPRLSNDQGLLLARVANLARQQRLVQLIAPAHLMDGGEIADLAAMAG